MRKTIGLLATTVFAPVFASPASAALSDKLVTGYVPEVVFSGSCLAHIDGGFGSFRRNGTQGNAIITVPHFSVSIPGNPQGFQANMWGPATMS